MLPWIFGPFAAGLLSLRFSERRVWAAALVGQAIVPVILVILPSPWIVEPAAFWYGLMNALMWVGGVSLAQVVIAEKKGLSNGLLMVAAGVGSLVAPVVGRWVLWHDQVRALVHSGNLLDVARFLVNLIKTQTGASLPSFHLIMWSLVVMAGTSAVMIYVWGQRPGQWRGDGPTQADWRRSGADVRRLAAEPRFWALVWALCLLGGPIFQASNQFLLYRATDLRLIIGSQDDGWILLDLLKKFMWIPGGLAVGLVAGRRAPGVAAVSILGGFALGSAWIGWSATPLALFGAVALFEFVRQFMRWSHAGYMSEHMPEELRATAIGLAITVAGTSSTIFGFVANWALDPKAPEFDSRQPFWVAAVLGLTGAIGLFVFDRFIPIRQAQTRADDLNNERPPLPLVAGAQIDAGTSQP